MTIPEILAPAGSSESLKSAINAGADAVYLSGKRFGARQFAENFTLTQIEESINYAHLRGVKVYIAVNTLIKDREVLSAAEYLFKLYEMGADAVIIQDVGLAHLARKIVPDLTLHTSTQMTIHHPEGVHWAQEMGFKRVVLSRELSLEEIKEMDRSSDIELEIFLHGALCYCYSGQCLLSSFIGGRSGNRGMCAQPCRKPYTMIVGEKDPYGRPSKIQEISLKDRYLISPKDLALYSNLNLLMDSGVSSLKIEGRMRSPEYVEVVVSTYRHTLDKIKKGKWETAPQDLETLKLAFNRGLTPGHLLKSRGKQLMGRDKPGHRGLHLGKIKQYNPKKREVIIQLKTITKPQKGDGLFFESSPDFNSKNKSPGFGIGVGIDVEQDPQIKGNEVSFQVRKPIPVRSEVYLTRRHNLVKNIRHDRDKTAKLDADQISRRSKQKLDISFKLSEENFPILEGELQTSQGDKIRAQVVGKVGMEKARTKPLNKNDIKKQLLKVGTKSFETKINNFEYPGDLFLPLSELNKVRRELIEKIELEILKSYFPHQKDLKDAENRLHQLKKELKKGSEKKTQKEYNNDLASSDHSEKSSTSTPSSPKREDFTIKESGKTKSNIPETSHLNEPSPPIKLSVYLDDLNCIESALAAGFKRIYLEQSLLPEGILSKKCFSKSLPEKIKYDAEYVTESLREASALCKDSQCDLIWKWPNITRSPVLNFLKAIQQEISLKDTSFPRSSLDIMVGNPALARYLKNKYENVNLYGSSALNVWNHRSVAYLSSFFSLINISPELSYKDLTSLFNYTRRSHQEGHLELIVQGNLEAMISEDCVISPDWLSASQMENLAQLEKFGGLKDEKNQVFPFKISSDCQTIILNSVETCLIDHVPLIIDLGVQNLAIDAKGRGAKYVQKMGQYYQQALQLSYNKDNLPQNAAENNENLAKIKKQVKKISQGGITAGNFLRGVEL